MAHRGGRRSVDGNSLWNSPATQRPADSIGSPLADASKPDLRVRIPVEQMLRCSIVIPVNLVVRRLDVDGDEPVFVFWPKNGLDKALIDILAPLRKLFSTVTCLTCGHGFCPIESLNLKRTVHPTYQLASFWAKGKTLSMAQMLTCLFWAVLYNKRSKTMVIRLGDSHGKSTAWGGTA
jgi:hypothetical protein